MPKKSPTKSAPEASATHNRKPRPMKVVTTKGEPFHPKAKDRPRLRIVVGEAPKPKAKKSAYLAPARTSSKIPAKLRALIKEFIQTAIDTDCPLVATSEEVEDCGISLVTGEDIPCFCVAEDRSGAFLGLRYPDARAVQFKASEVE